MLGRKLFSIGLVLALVEVVSIPAHAELFKNLKLDGSIETRSFGIDNETDRNGTAEDYRSETNARLMFGSSFDLLDDVHARVLADRVANHGGTAGPSLTTLESTILVDNAYVKIDKLFNHLDLTVGRQFYGDPNDLNIYYGPNNDDVLSVASVDAFRADADIMGWAKFQGLAAKIADTGATGATSNTDTDVFGGEVNTDKVVPKGNLAAYYYTRKIHALKPPAAGNNTLNVTGVRAKGDIIAGLGYHAEYIQNFGRNNVTGTAYDGNAYFLGFNYGRDVNAMPFRAKLEYGRGSRDFAAVAPSARFGKIWGEHTTVGPSTLNRGTSGTAASLSNLKVIDAGVGINPISKLGLDLNWYRFIYDANVGGIGTSAGSELDFIVSWKHSENVSLEASVARFFVGTSLQNTALVGTNPITRLGADIKIKY